VAVKNIQEVVPYAVNFSIVVVFLSVVLRKPLRKYVYQRHERIRDSIESATIAFNRAKERADRASAALRGLAGEVQGIKESERQAALREKQQIEAAAQTESARWALEGQRMAEADAQEAGQKIKEQFLRLVVAQAEAKISGGLDKGRHEEILKGARASIEAGAQ
jgi:F0F1-type ATP synthase membrane subunit b/b'